jgi:hypothetical protein
LYTTPPMIVYNNRDRRSYYHVDYVFN